MLGEMAVDHAYFGIVVELVFGITETGSVLGCANRE